MARGPIPKNESHIAFEQGVVMKRVVCFFCSLIGVMVSHTVANAQAPLVFVTSFAAGADGAIHAYELDSDSGRLQHMHSTADVEHPFFIAVSPHNRFLYSIHAKTFGGKEDEFVAAFELVGRSGRLKPINRQSARGTAACYLDVDATGRSVVVANYSSGSVASLPVDAIGGLEQAATFVQHKGSSVNPARQQEPHAHCIVISPDNRFAFAADLGLDQILVYELAPNTAKLTASKPAFVKTDPGAGPRHLTFHPNGNHVYVINELLNSVTHFDYDAESGTLTKRETTSTLPDDFDGTSYCADLSITPDGQFLYGTNRGHDSIAVFRINNAGQLKRLAIEPSLGKGPQNLAISADGKLLLCANMPGNNVAAFRINQNTGELTSVGEPLNVVSPSCIVIR